MRRLLLNQRASAPLRGVEVSPRLRAVAATDGIRRVDQSAGDALKIRLVSHD